MRQWLIGIVLVFGTLAVIVIWPYRFEEPRLIVASNPTGCEMDQTVPSGWQAPFPAPFTVWRMNEPAQVRVELFRCPGLPRGAPAAVTLTHDGKTYRGEACGAEEASLPCYVTVPTVPGRYRLMVQLKADEAPHAIDIELVRETLWRPLWWDTAMSV